MHKPGMAMCGMKIRLLLLLLLLLRFVVLIFDHSQAKIDGGGGGGGGLRTNKPRRKEAASSSDESFASGRICSQNYAAAVRGSNQQRARPPVFLFASPRNTKAKKSGVLS